MEERAIRKGFGPRRLKAELEAKGVATEAIEQALAETGDEGRIRQEQLAALAREASHLGLDLRDQVLQPDQVLREMWTNPKRGFDPIIVKALINLLGVYPVGTCVILDTLEVAVVSHPNPDPQLLNRPRVRIALEATGGMIAPPGRPADLTERGPSGSYLRSIVKVTNPERYNLTVGDYFL